jgi:hypothetical protein
LQFLTP